MSITINSNADANAIKLSGHAHDQIIEFLKKKDQVIELKSRNSREAKIFAIMVHL